MKAGGVDFGGNNIAGIKFDVRMLRDELRLRGEE